MDSVPQSSSKMNPQYEIQNFDRHTSCPEQTVDILLTKLWNVFFLYKNVCIFIQISWKFVPKGFIQNESWLIQVMAWSRTGDWPLTGGVLTPWLSMTIYGIIGPQSGKNVATVEVQG